MGPYIVDFYCPQAKLIIELDGAQHYEEPGLTRDAERTKYLESKGNKVLRISNKDVNEHFRDVCDCIEQNVRERLKELGKDIEIE